MFNYDTHVRPYAENFIKVKIPKEKIEKLEKFVKELVEAKKSETHHMIDSNNEYKRHYTGLLGELALEELLGIEIIDWTIGNSNSYNKPDISGLKVGIKTVEYGKFPVIFIKSFYPEIIAVKKSDNVVYICGLAKQDILNKYQSDSLILSPSLRNRRTKTGFYGFNELQKFTNLDELKTILR